MKIRNIIIPAVLAMAVLLSAGCAGKSTLSEANALRKDGKCQEAIQLYTDIINQWPSDKEVAHALYNRAACHESLGDYDMAFGNYYAAQAMACAAVNARKDPNPSLGTISMSAYCDDIIPKKMIEISKHVPQEKRAADIQYVRERLPKRLDF